jgi:hypothetical protein
MMRVMCHKSLYHKIKSLQHRELKMMLTSIKPRGYQLNTKYPHDQSTVQCTQYMTPGIKKIPDLSDLPDLLDLQTDRFLSFPSLLTALALALVDFYCMIDI